MSQITINLTPEGGISVATECVVADSRRVITTLHSILPGLRLAGVLERPTRSPRTHKASVSETLK
jgi:hypothetical protein